MPARLPPLETKPLEFKGEGCFAPPEWAQNLERKIDKMDQNLNTKLDKIKAAEDRLGVAIDRAVATNAANLKKLADLVDASDDPEIQEILDKATAHADAMEAAFGKPSDADDRIMKDDSGTSNDTAAKAG